MASWHFCKVLPSKVLVPCFLLLCIFHGILIRVSASDKLKDSWELVGSRLMWRQLHSVSFCASWCCKSRHFVIPPSWILNEHGGQQKTLLVGWYIWSSLGGEAALRRGNESCQRIIIASEQELVQNTGLSFFPFKNVVAVTGGLGTVHGWHQITDWGHQGRSNTANETLISVISYFSLSYISSSTSLHFIFWYYNLLLET